MTRAQVLRHYRDKDQVEKAFMNLKVRLNMRRLRMSSQPGLEGKLFVRYLALILAPELEHRIEQANLFKDYKLDEVLKAFNHVECFIHSSFSMIIGEILLKTRSVI